jgi:rhamnogalacturonyl hydrolase YesR
MTEILLAGPQSINQSIRTHYYIQLYSNTQKKEIQKKRKSQKESVPVSPALYHGLFMLKSNVDTPIELDTIMCAFLNILNFVNAQGYGDMMATVYS